MLRAYTRHPPPLWPSQLFPIEFPKWITPPGGEPIIVNTAEEEAALMSTEPADATSRDDLIAQAESLGLKIDRRWSDDRIRTTIETAESGPGD